MNPLHASLFAGGGGSPLECSSYQRAISKMQCRCVQAPKSDTVLKQ
jgi:hypothetical protein